MSDNSQYPTPEEMERRQSSVREKLQEIARTGRKPDASKTAPSAPLIRLAGRQGRNADEIARKLDPETLRKTRFPVLEQRTEDGLTVFKHVPEIISDGRRGSGR